MNTTANEPRRLWSRQASFGFLLLPGVLLAAFGAVHIFDGFAVDAAVPVPSYMVAEITMPKAAYADAVAALAGAERRDGEAAVERAEAGWHAGVPNGWLRGIVEDGLRHDPASFRGWTLLSEILAVHDKKAAAKTFTQALTLAPRDYWLAAERTKVGAMLWPELDSDTRNLALDQARMLWQEPVLRPQLRKVANTPGAALMSRAFRSEPDTIREINRWLSQQSRGGAR